MLLDHGRLLALPSSEHASYDVDHLRRFMASHRAELDAAHLHCDRALAEWADLSEHRVKRFANVQMSKMWEALAPKRVHAQWVNVWCVLALLRTHCLAEAAIERAISLPRRFTSSMQDLLET